MVLSGWNNKCRRGIKRIKNKLYLGFLVLCKFDVLYKVGFDFCLLLFILLCEN